MRGMLRGSIAGQGSGEKRQGTLIVAWATKILPVPGCWFPVLFAVPVAGANVSDSRCLAKRFGDPRVRRYFVTAATNSVL